MMNVEDFRIMFRAHLSHELWDKWRNGQLDENEWALTGSVDDMIAKVDGLRGNVTKDRLDEGIVWHLHEDQQLSEGLANELGSNRCFKIINNKYLTKNGL